MAALASSEPSPGRESPRAATPARRAPRHRATRPPISRFGRERSIVTCTLHAILSSRRISDSLDQALGTREIKQRPAAPGAGRRRWRSSPTRPRRTGRGPARRRPPTSPPSGRVEVSRFVRRSDSGLNRTTLISTAPIHSFALGPVEAKAGDHVGVVSFLEPDHPLGVGPVERLVEDDAVHGADGVGGEDQARPSAAWPRPWPSARRGAPRIPPARSRTPGRARRRRKDRPRRRSRPPRAVAAAGARRWPGSSVGFIRSPRPIPQPFPANSLANDSRSYARGPLPTSRKATHLERTGRPVAIAWRTRTMRPSHLALLAGLCLLFAASSADRRGPSRAGSRSARLPDRGRSLLSRTRTSPS